MNKYVAFLRGINVGGNKKVPMKELIECFEKMGFTNIHTLLASGNVVFEGKEAFLSNVESNLEKTFGFPIDTIIFPSSNIKDIINSQPFINVEYTPNKIFYLTFFREITKSNILIPYSTNDGSFHILKISNNAIFSVVEKDKTGTVQAMKILEKQFGKQLTTRNFNTVKKLSKFL